MPKLLIFLKKPVILPVPMKLIGERSLAHMGFICETQSKDLLGDEDVLWEGTCLVRITKEADAPVVASFTSWGSASWRMTAVVISFHPLCGGRSPGRSASIHSEGTPDVRSGIATRSIEMR